MSQNNLYLIGPMGSGKSAVGRRLARLLQRDFFDSDEEIEKSTGVDISFIFEKEGETGFRTREEKMIHKLCQSENVVLATGGGAVLSENNRKILSDTGTVIYLKTSIGEQLKRTRGRSNRPLLNTESPDQVLMDLAAVRNPLYRSMADITTTTDRLHVYKVARTIIEQLKRLRKPLTNSPLNRE